MDYSKLSIQETLNELDSNNNGLNDAQVEHKLNIHGQNTITQEHNVSMFKRFLYQFKDMLVIILLIAGFISVITGSFADAAVIMVIVLMNAGIGFMQEFKAEKSLEALKNMISPNCTVLRQGIKKKIDVKFLVPGDIVILEEGDKISADCRVIEAHDIRINESALTGESEPVDKNSEILITNAKNQKSNLIFMGTDVVHGWCKAIVTSTGMNTEFGKISKLTLSIDNELSPLKKELNKVGNFIAKFALVVSLIVFIFGIYSGETVFKMFFYAISLAIAVVPEGLQTTITVALAIGVQKLAKKNAIIKQLSSIETLGCTTVICTDKTGTLTQNKMTVKEIYVNDQIHKVDNMTKLPINLTQMIKTAVLCNNASFNGTKLIGDPTETALIKFGMDQHLNKISLEKTFERIDEIPFDSNKKTMFTLNHHKSDKSYYVFAKGAPRQLLAACTHFAIDNKIKKLTEKERKKILEENRNLASQAYRVLAFAYKKQTTKPKKTEIETKLIFTGLMAMIDPPRPQIAQTIQECHNASINVIMITGDQKQTALAIAKQIGIIKPNQEINENTIISGIELDKLNNEQLLDKLKTTKVFARVSPEHKYKIVSLLKRQKEIVAMTGDGVNDAPALKKADIGIAMGISGTEVSKEAANMILTDDSFTTIANSIFEGRAIYENIRKVVTYVFSGISAELFAILIALALSLPLPLAALQILFIDLGTEVLPALALSVEKGSPELMNRKPRSQRERLLNTRTLSNILITSSFKTIFTLFLFVETLNTQGLVKAQTVSMVFIVMSQMFNTFNFKNLTESVLNKRAFDNKFIFGAIAVSFIATIIIVQTPLNSLFHATSLTLIEWLELTLISFLIIPYFELVKWFRRVRNANK